ncbi:MAG TPA: hypothetical protein VJ719_06900 [Chthoniobacterales bacterium]|nr:hypothetical protein [Chthoniobacterales bacterium]
MPVSQSLRRLKRRFRDVVDYLPPLPRLPSRREMNDWWHDLYIPSFPSPRNVVEWFRERRHEDILPKLPSAQDIAERFRDRPPKELRGSFFPTIPSIRELPNWFREDPRRKKYVAYWAVALVILIGLGFATPTLARAIKGWQAKRLAAQATLFADQQNWLEASKKIRAAFQLRYTEPGVWRSYAHLLTRTGQGTLAVEWWQKVSKSLPLTIEDHRDFAAAALSARELAIASDQIGLLLSQNQNPATADIQLAGQLATLRGYNRTAIGFAEQILSDSRALPNEKHVANLIILANTVPASPEYKAAFERIVQTARDESNPASAQALTFLAQQQAPQKLTAPSTTAIDVTLPDVSGAAMSLKEIAQRLNTNPNSRPFQKMLALELELRANSQSEDALVKKAVELYGEGDEETLIALGSWLYSHRRFQTLLEVIPLDRAVQRRELLLEHIDALAALNRLNDVKEILVTEHAVMDPAAQHMYLAVVRLKLNDPTAAANEWIRALETADTPRSLIGLADYAEKNGKVDIADAAYERLIKKQPELKSTYLSRFQLAQSLGQTDKAHELALEIIHFWPEDDATHMREIYLRLLLDPSADTAVAAEAEAGPFVARNPWNGAARSALAFAQLRQGKAAAALNTLTEFTPGIPFSAVSASVYAAALAANGWTDKARAQAESLKTESILPEERALIAPLLGSGD